MLDTLKIFEELKSVMEPAIAKKIADILSGIYEELSNTVTKAEFKELKEVVADLADKLNKLAGNINELAEAQRKTEERLNQLAEVQRRMEERMNQLEEAQRRTEETMNQLAEAQKKTEETMNKLAEAQRRMEERMNQFEEAQRRTEETMNQLAEAQKKTEKTMNKLAEAQRKTETEILKLTKTVSNLQKQVGGISHTIGYYLEDRAIYSLPELLHKDYGVEVDSLERGFIVVGGEEIQLNIYGWGKVNGKKVFIMGEAKVEPSVNDINKFLKTVNFVKRYENIEVFPLIVGYLLRPRVKEHALRSGIKVYSSYQLKL